MEDGGLPLVHPVDLDDRARRLRQRGERELLRDVAHDVRRLGAGEPVPVLEVVLFA